MNLLQVRLTIPDGVYQIGFKLMYNSISPADIGGMLYDIEVQTGACLDICMYAQIGQWIIK